MPTTISDPITWDTKIVMMLRNVNKHFKHHCRGYKPSDDVKKCQQSFMAPLLTNAKG
jgi:hypothetical protein